MKWLQYSGRLGIVFSLVLVGVLSYTFLASARQAWRQKPAIQHFRQQGGYVRYAYQVDKYYRKNLAHSHPQPGWPTSTLGEYAAPVYVLVLAETLVGDDDIEYLAGLPDLRLLDLSGTGVTDEGLAQLLVLPRLELLFLAGTGITDQGLRHLKSLANLEVLHLNDTETTDAGIALLTGSRLRALDLSGTKITDKAVDALSQMRQLQALFVERTSLSQRAIGQLRQTLTNTRVYD